MSNETIFYSLSALGVVAHMLAILWKRTVTLPEWIRDKYNQRYLIATVIAVVAWVLIGPGDGADIGSNAVRMNAFAFAGMGAEVIRATILGPSRTAERKAKAADKEAA